MNATSSAVLFALLAVACSTPRQSQSAPSTPAATAQPAIGDVAITQPPYTEVHASYKHRLEQPYIYVEHIGSYVETGRLLPQLHKQLREAHVEVSGPPFGLYYDDPGAVAVDELRSRACFPVDGPPPADGAWKYEVLPSTSVAYAIVRGPYPEVPRAHAGLLAYMGRMGWVVDGPIREIYLVAPGDPAQHANLLCEVQVPVTGAR